MAARLMRRLMTFGIVFSASSSALADDNWPQWRGADQSGVSDATGLPETWSESEGIVWRTELPSWSGSSPVVWGDRIYLTTPSRGEGDSARNPNGRFESPGGNQILLLCISKADGKILWEKELASGNELGRKGNSSSPTPVTDGQHVWTVTGTGAVTAMTMDGDKVWSKNLQEMYGPFGLNFVYASSPLLHDGKLIAQVLHGMNTDDPSYVVALDAKTGDVLWRVERPTDEPSETPDAYNTPTIIQEGDKTRVIVCGGGFVSAHDPDTGAEVWRAGGLNPKNNGNFRTIASAVAVDGMVYAPTRQRPLLAIKAGGTGDVSTSHLAWKWDEAYGPDVPTPACDGQYFYMVDDKGVATCLNAKTGDIVWGPEHAAEGTISASPIVADGKIFITNEAGTTTVIAAGSTYRKIATNTLPGENHTLSTIAISGNRIYLRTPGHLYCIGKP
ncbi:MAG: hypothetical protein AMXMBFR84_26810 [Candidatus Hydrogenedentota bacterium]